MAITISIIYFSFFYIIGYRAELTGSSDIAFDGDKFTLTCKLDGALKINWFRDEYFMGVTAYQGAGANACRTSGIVTSNYRLICNSHQVIIDSVNYYKEKDIVWECQDVFYKSIFSQYTIRTGVRVENVKLEIEGYDTKTIQSEEGITLSVSCSTPFAFPVPSLSICIRDGDFNTKCSKNTSLSYQLQIKTEKYLDNSVIYCTANNTKNKHPTSNLIRFQLLYPPQLNISLRRNSENKTSLICSASGRPDNFTFYDWEHYIKDELIRTMPGYEKNNTSSLNISDSDYGVFVCTVSNGIRQKAAITDKVFKSYKLQLFTEKPFINENTTMPSISIIPGRNATMTSKSTMTSNTTIISKSILTGSSINMVSTTVVFRNGSNYSIVDTSTIGQEYISRNDEKILIYILVGIAGFVSLVIAVLVFVIIRRRRIKRQRILGNEKDVIISDNELYIDSGQPIGLMLKESSTKDNNDIIITDNDVYIASNMDDNAN